MSTSDTIEAAERRRQSQRGPDKAPPQTAENQVPAGRIDRSGRKGRLYGKVRLTIDGGKITLEMGQADDLPNENKGEQNEWDEV